MRSFRNKLDLPEIGNYGEKVIKIGNMKVWIRLKKSFDLTVGGRKPARTPVMKKVYFKQKQFLADTYSIWLSKNRKFVKETLCLSKDKMSFIPTKCYKNWC